MLHSGFFAATSQEHHFDDFDKQHLLKASLQLQEIQDTQGSSIPYDWFSHSTVSTSPESPLFEASHPTTSFGPSLEPTHTLRTCESSLTHPQSDNFDGIESSKDGDVLGDPEALNALKELEICFSTIRSRPYKSCAKCESPLTSTQCAGSPVLFRLNPEILAALKELEVCWSTIRIEGHEARSTPNPRDPETYAALKELEFYQSTVEEVSESYEPTLTPASSTNSIRDLPGDLEIYGALKRLEGSSRSKSMHVYSNTRKSLRGVGCAESRVGRKERRRGSRCRNKSVDGV